MLHTPPSRRRSPSNQPSRHRRLHVEQLEARTLLATFTWDPPGGGAGNWNDPQNWGSYAGSPIEGRDKYPGAEDGAIFSESDQAAQVTLGGTVQAAYLYVHRDVAFSGSLEVGSATFRDGESQVSGLLTVGDDLELDVGVALSVSGSLSVGGYLAIDDEGILAVGGSAAVGSGVYLDPKSSLQVGGALSSGGRIDVRTDAQLTADTLSSGDGLNVFQDAVVTAYGTVEVHGHANLSPGSGLQAAHLLVGGSLGMAGTGLNLPGYLQVSGHLGVEDGHIILGNGLLAGGVNFRRSEVHVGGSFLVAERVWVFDSTLQVSGDAIAAGTELLLERSTLTVAPQSAEGSEGYFGELTLGESKASFHNTHVTVARSDGSGDVWLIGSSELSVTAGAPSDENLRGAFSAKRIWSRSSSAEHKLTFRNVATNIGLLDVRVGENSSLDVEGGEFRADSLDWRGTYSPPGDEEISLDALSFHRTKVQSETWVTYNVEVGLWDSSLVVKRMESRGSAMQVIDGSTLEVQESLFIHGGPGGTPATSASLLVAAEGMVIVGDLAEEEYPERSFSSIHVYPQGTLHLVGAWLEAAQMEIKHRDQPGTDEPLRGTVLAVGGYGPASHFSGSLKNDGLLTLVGPTIPDTQFVSSGRLRIDQGYEQTDDGRLELPSLTFGPPGTGTRESTPALDLGGEVELAGTLRLVDTGIPGGTLEDGTIQHVGHRSSLIQLEDRSKLDGRFTKLEGLARSLSPNTLSVPGMEEWFFTNYPDGLDATFFAIHYEPKNAVIQSYVVEAPRLIGGNTERLTTQGEVANPSATGLVIVIHGSGDNAEGWTTEMAEAIRKHASSERADVVALDWGEFASGVPEDPVHGENEWRPWTSSSQAISIGESLGMWLKEAGLDNYNHVHILSKSAGSWLADALSDQIKKSIADPPFIHLTLFDAFAPEPDWKWSTQHFVSLGKYPHYWSEEPIEKWGQRDKDGRSVQFPETSLGESADYAEQYFDSRSFELVDRIGPPLNTVIRKGTHPAVPLTDVVLSNFFNIDVTALDHGMSVLIDDNGRPPWEQFDLNQILQKGGTFDGYTFRSHGWPDIYYLRTVTKVSLFSDSDIGFSNSYEFRGHRAMLDHDDGIHGKKKVIYLPNDRPVFYTDVAHALQASNSTAVPPSAVTYAPGPEVAAELQAAADGSSTTLTTEVQTTTALARLSITFEFPGEVGGVLRIAVDGAEVQVVMSPFFDEPLAGVFTTGWISLDEILPAGRHTITFTLEAHEDEEATVQIRDLVLGTVEGWHSPWHNAAEPGNVNGDPDGKVDILDLLAVVNWLVRNQGNSDLPAVGDPAALGYVDVNDDGKADILDLLAVVNILVRRTHGQADRGEGEPAVPVVVRTGMEDREDVASDFAREIGGRTAVEQSEASWYAYLLGSRRARRHYRA